MVFCGKPSQGCDRCRQRRLKCDRLPDGCGQCSRKSIQCPGYRNQLDLMFRDQSEEIARKAKVKRQTSGDYSSRESHGQRNCGCKFNQQKHSVEMAIDESWCDLTTGDAPSFEHGIVILKAKEFRGGMTVQNYDIKAQLYTPRLDYIESYHGQDRARVIRCLNYYIKFAGPNYIWREEVITRGSIDQFAKYFLQATLAEPLFLEAVLAICQADLDLRNQSGSNASSTALKHHTRSLGLLRDRLASTTALNDGIMLASIIAMIVYHMTMGDWTSYGVHLEYLRQAMIACRRSDHPDWQGWISYAYTWAELRWANHLVHMARSSKDKPSTKGQLDYTADLTVTGLCYWATKLPIGLHKSIFSNTLGARVCEFLSQVTVWTTQIKVLNNGVVGLGELNIQGLVLAQSCAEIISSSGLTQVESLICIAVMAYIISLIEGPVGHSRGLEDLTADLDLVDLESLDKECCIWVAMAMAAANDTFPTTLPNRWLFLDCVMELDETCQTWPETLEVLRRFFWDERHAGKWKRCWETALEVKNAKTPGETKC